MHACMQKIAGLASYGTRQPHSTYGGRHSAQACLLACMRTRVPVHKYSPSHSPRVHAALKGVHIVLREHCGHCKHSSHVLVRLASSSFTPSLAGQQHRNAACHSPVPSARRWPHA